MSRTSLVQVDFGHRSVDVTIGQLQDWQAAYDHDDACKALGFKTTTKPAAVQQLIADIAAATPGAAQFKCISCGAMTYGAEGVIGPELCGPCFELAGIDNEINDTGVTEIEADAMAEIRSHLDAIEAAGGSALDALKTCDYIRNVGVRV